MKKLFVIVLLAAISFCLYSCSSAKQQNETLKQDLSKGILQHFNDKNYDEAGEFTSFIGNTHDIVEFKKNGDVVLRLSKNNQVFDITKKHQQHRLRGLKNLMLQAK
jgi:hypothetical protein